MGKLFVRDKNFYKQLVVIALPVVLQSMINIGVNIMDTVMLGSYGEVQISASSLANDFIHIFMFTILGIGGGSAVLTAQYWGRQDITSLRKIITIMLRISLGLVFVFTVVTAIFPEQIMRIYTTDAAVIEKGVLYLRVSLPTYLLMGLNMTLTAVLRSVRAVKIPLITVCVSFFVNIFFNWVFIFGKLGAPEMQIAGAALGTVIARVVESVIILTYVFKLDKKVCYKLKDLFVSVKGYRHQFFKYCLPVVGSDVLFGFGNTMLTIIIGHTNTEFVAANAIVATVVRLTCVFSQGVANAGGIITGNTIGAGKVEEGFRGAVTFLCLTVLTGALSGLLVLLICPAFVQLYDITETTYKIARELMLAVAVMSIFSAMENALTKGILRAGGDTRFLLVADVLFMWVVSVPLGALVALVWKAPPFFIYVSLRIDWIIKSLWCTGRLISRKWIHVVESPDKPNVIAEPEGKGE